MRVAIIHDSLVEFGGAERVLLALLELFPSADVFTAYTDESFLRKFFPDLPVSRLQSSWADGTIVARHGSLFQCLSPLVWRSFKFDQHDLVISVTSYLGANMISVKHAVHIQYILSLPKNLFGLEPPFRLQKIFPYASIVSRFFCQSLSSTPFILSDSEHISRVLYEKTGVSSRVIYPPVVVPRVLPNRKKSAYYLCVSRIDNTKSIEISVEACTRLALPLKIVGKTNEPRYEQYLRSIAGPTIEFLGFLSDKDVQELYTSAIAFIFTAKNEDFGIAPIEAMANGVPVIAYYGGGLKETVIPGKTGVFFYEHNANSLIVALRGFQRERFSSRKLYEHARLYDRKKFKSEMSKYIHLAVDRPKTQAKDSVDQK